MTLQDIPAEAVGEYEVLVDTSASVRGGGLAWCRVRKISPNAKFPVGVVLPDGGKASYDEAEVHDVRRIGAAMDPDGA